MSTLPTIQDYLDAELRRQVVRLAEHLRHHADRIEHMSKTSLYRKNGSSRHVWLATDVLSELRALQGNAAMVEQIVTAASDAQHESDVPTPPESTVTD